MTSVLYYVCKYGTHSWNIKKIIIMLENFPSSYIPWIFWASCGSRRCSQGPTYRCYWPLTDSRRGTVMVFIVHPGTRSPPCLNVLRVPRSLSSQIIRETRNVKFTGLSFQGKQCNICFPPRRPGIAVVNYRVTFALCRARSRSDPDLPDLFIPRSPSLDLHH